jgi:hypothetical protein
LKIFQENSKKGINIRPFTNAFINRKAESVGQQRYGPLLALNVRVAGWASGYNMEQGLFASDSRRP